MPVLSVIMPSLNVAPYMRECIESVIKQTLKDIEIICVDAGSTDGTLEIIHEYADKDARIKLIVSDKKSYGYQMNLGLDASSGKYIGVVETDDWIEPDMFNDLYTAAETNNADVVKSNYYWYYTKPNVKNQFFENLAACKYRKIFNINDSNSILAVTPSIWSGIYSREMLLKNNVRFNETPGASYQDTSFHFCVFTVAERIYLLREGYLHYRRDNESSSVNSSSKVFCVSDEMEFYEKYLSHYPQKEKYLITIFQPLKYEKYRWNYERLDPKYQCDFLKKIYDEFRAAKAKGYLKEELFASTQWDNLNLILRNPEKYYLETGKKPLDFKPIRQSVKPELIIASKIPDPKITVIMPVYNTAPYLNESLVSIINQTIKEIEIICINDGSKDNSLEILKKYASEDDRITVLSQTNCGQSAARNAGIKHARGKYIYFFDSDDKLSLEALETFYKKAEDCMLDILYFDADTFYDPPELINDFSAFVSSYSRDKEYGSVYSGRSLFAELVNDNNYKVSVCLQFFRTEFLKNKRLDFIEGILQEDNAFSFKCILNADRVSHINKAYFHRRVRSNSVMTKPIGYDNMYGYLRCFIDMVSVGSSEYLGSEVDYSITTTIENIGNHVRSIFKKLPDDEIKYIKTLSKLERFWLDMILLSENSNRKQIMSIYNSAGSMGYQSEAEMILASKTYKIGSLITWIPKKIRGLLRCLSENGWRYTVRRTMEHLHIDGLIPQKKEPITDKKDSSIKVSVIIPIYNADKFLVQCIDSIVKQTLKEIEIICVDDGSTDNSLSILREYEKKDPRVKILTQKNGGAGAARNHGLKMAQGEYLSFLDSDDFFDRNMLELSYRKALAEDADIVIFGADRYNNQKKRHEPLPWAVRKWLLPEKKVFSGTDIEKDIFYSITGWPWDKLFKRSFVLNEGILYQEQRTTNDLLFVYALYAKAKRITLIDNILVHQRYNVASSLSRTREKSWECFYNALIALRRQLTEWNLYGRFEKDYINYALNLTLWNLNTLTGSSYTQLYNKLKTEWFDDLGISGHEKSYFYRADEYDQYLNIISNDPEPEKPM